MNRLVLTGATGFLGERVLHLMLDEGREVDAWVRSPEKLDGLDDPNLDVVPWEAGDDVPDQGRLRDADALVHLAAYLPPSYSETEHAAQCFRVNAMGTLKLLEQAAEAGVPKFIYISSGNVYRPDRDTAAEAAPTYPSWRAPFYLTSKLSGEIFVDYFRGQNAFESAIVLRPSAIYGPGMDSGVIKLFARRLVDGAPIEVHDGGRHRVDPVYVDDVVQAVDLSLSHSGSGQFNVGSGRAHSMLELAESLVSICEVSPDLMTVHPSDDPGESPQGFPALDITRAREQLGYSPRSFEQGLRALVDALRDENTGV